MSGRRTRLAPEQTLLKGNENSIHPTAQIFYSDQTTQMKVLELQTSKSDQLSDAHRRVQYSLAPVNIASKQMGRRQQAILQKPFAALNATFDFG